jgi:hypothetical protein
MAGSYSEETCTSFVSSTTNLKWTDPGSNPDRRDRNYSTNRLSYSTLALGFTQSLVEISISNHPTG